MVQSPKQLQRYFNNVPSARIAILTNGIDCRFYADLVEKNQMDAEPFIVSDIKDIRPRVAKELKRLVKDTFDLDGMLEAAEGLKYMRGILAELDKEWSDPSDELVKLFAGRVYHGRQMRNTVIERFRPIVKHALDRFFTERVSKLMDRTKQAAERDAGLDQKSVDQPEVLPDGVVSKVGDIITTQEEVDGYHVVKAIVRRVVEGDRVIMRDTKSYCGILLDDNNRKPICSLRFNRGTKYLGILDEDKSETRITIESVDDIYDHADALVATVERYLAAN